MLGPPAHGTALRDLRTQIVAASGMLIPYSTVSLGAQYVLPIAAVLVVGGGIAWWTVRMRTGMRSRKVALERLAAQHGMGTSSSPGRSAVTNGSSCWREATPACS